MDRVRLQNVFWQRPEVTGSSEEHCSERVQSYLEVQNPQPGRVLKLEDSAPWYLQYFRSEYGVGIVQANPYEHFEKICPWMIPSDVTSDLC